MKDEMLELALKVVPGNEDIIACTISAIKAMVIECDIDMDMMREWCSTNGDLFPNEKTRLFVEQALAPRHLKHSVRKNMQENWIRTLEASELEKYTCFIAYMGLSAMLDNNSPTDIMYQMLSFVILSSISTVLELVEEKQIEYARTRAELLDGDALDSIFCKMEADMSEEEEEEDDPLSKSNIQNKQTVDIEAFEPAVTGNFIDCFREFFHNLNEKEHEVLKNCTKSDAYYVAVLYSYPEDKKKMLAGFLPEETEKCFLKMLGQNNKKDEDVLLELLQAYNRCKSE